MINKKVLENYKKVEAEYYQKFGDGYLALVDPLHPREKDYLDGIEKMKLAIKDDIPLSTMAEGIIY